MPADSQGSRAELREAAVRLLARREHSRRELAAKLARRRWPAGSVTEVLDELAAEGLQSDLRFAESYARQRAEKNYGPVHIRAELSERGIDWELIAGVMDALEVDWSGSAAAWYERRYGTRPPSDIGEKARRVQALSRRGFAHEHIRGLIPGF